MFHHGTFEVGALTMFTDAPLATNDSAIPSRTLDPTEGSSLNGLDDESSVPSKDLRASQSGG